MSPTTGTGKYEKLLARCKSLAVVPTAVAYPCEKSALESALEAGRKRLIEPLLVGPARTIEEIARKKVSGQKLTSTEALRLEEYKKAVGEAETANAMATAARAQALADKQTAELNSRLIESLQRNNGDILSTFYDIFIPRGTLGKK